jgi:hypothetical protein
MASRSKISDTQLSTMVSGAQEELVDLVGFRRVWVQYTRIGKERVDIVITLFPLVGTYRMVFFRGINVSTISTRSIVGLINVDN